MSILFRRATRDGVNLLIDAKAIGIRDYSDWYRLTELHNQPFSETQFELAWVLENPHFWAHDGVHGFYDDDSPAHSVYYRAMKKAAFDILVRKQPRTKIVRERVERGLHSVSIEALKKLVDSLWSQIRGGVGKTRNGFYDGTGTRKTRLLRGPWMKIETRHWDGTIK